jgi:hypothetical protein
MIGWVSISIVPFSYDVDVGRWWYVLWLCSLPWWDFPRWYNLTFVTFAKHHLDGNVFDDVHTLIDVLFLKLDLDGGVLNVALMIKPFSQVWWGINHVIVLWWCALGLNLGGASIFYFILFVLLSLSSSLGDTTYFHNTKLWSTPPHWHTCSRWFNHLVTVWRWNMVILEN